MLSPIELIANRVNSQGHADYLTQQLATDIPFYGWMPNESQIVLAERHLGLVQAQELANIEQTLDKSAQLISQTKLQSLPPAVPFSKPETKSVNGIQGADTIVGALKGRQIMVINDLAFNFLYHANLALLKKAGAEWVFSSPLKDPALPVGDALYIPGGYPELYAEDLSQNYSYIASLQAFAKAQNKIVAECGGMLYLLTELVNSEGKRYPMAGLLPGKARMQKSLTAIGSQSVSLPS